MSLIITVVLVLVAGFFLGWAFARRRTTSADDSEPQEKENSDVATPRDIFALSRLFEATINGMREGLLVVDHDMRVVASNPAAFRLFNANGKKLNSQRLTELTRNPAICGAFLDALQGQERSGVKVETYDSNRRVFDLRVVPINESGGGTQGAIGVFFDITRLEKLERVRQEFLSNVSHELRTPLTAIIAFVETLEAGALEEQENSRRFLGIIRKNASRMHNLIDDILKLSAIEDRNIRVEPRDTRLQPVVSDVVNSLAAKAAWRGIRINNDVDPDVVVFADQPRLEQMLTNLIDNAIKFNREAGSVTISCENGKRSRILIRDTGDGIPAQHLDRLFERFYRVDKARSRELGGTGLGLAIVKHLARAHNGEVNVESKLGEGSTFIIDLPRQAEVADLPLTSRAAS